MERHRGRPAGRLALAGLAALCGFALAGEASAQSPWGLAVSLTVDGSIGGEPMLDHELAFRAPGVAPGHVLWPAETLALLAGDAQGTKPLHWTPTDIDAAHDRGGPDIAAHGLLFSITSNENGFKDGDILVAGALGYEVYIAESAFVSAVGAMDGNVDIDAFHMDPDGTLLFSFADNEASGTLSGDTPGVIQDGDILIWPAQATAAQILYTESQVSLMVSAALGATTTTGDTMGLARDPDTGAVLFTVQSPTAHDATVFSDLNGGTILAGFDEPSWGFGGSPELDAITVASWRFPALGVSDPYPQAGDGVTCSLRDARPDVPYVLLASFTMQSSSLPTAGWGGLVLGQDGLLALTWSSAAAFALLPDATGSAAVGMLVPAGIPPLDVVLQAVAPGATPEASNPVLLELAH